MERYVVIIVFQGAFFRGIFYEAIAGIATGAAEMAPLMLTGYYMETIQFNDLSGPAKPLRVAAMGLAGGAMYGGAWGLMLGTVYGPGVTLYLAY